MQQLQLHPPQPPTHATTPTPQRQPPAHRRQPPHRPAAHRPTAHRPPPQRPAPPQRPPPPQRPQPRASRMLSRSDDRPSSLSKTKNVAKLTSAISSSLMLRTWFGSVLYGGASGSDAVDAEAPPLAIARDTPAIPSGTALRCRFPFVGDFFRNIAEFSSTDVPPSQTSLRAVLDRGNHG